MITKPRNWVLSCPVFILKFFYTFAHCFHSVKVRTCSTLFHQTWRCGDCHHSFTSLWSRILGTETSLSRFLWVSSALPGKFNFGVSNYTTTFASTLFQQNSILEGLARLFRSRKSRVLIWTLRTAVLRQVFRVILGSSRNILLY